MAVSIVTLKTGDKIITEIKEVFEGEGENTRGICLLMEDPYILNIDNSVPSSLIDTNGTEYQVRFSKWNPYSTDWQFKIPYDCVMTISTPEPGLQKAWEEKIICKEERQND